MKEKNISQYRLVKAYGFSAGQLNRLKNNQYVSTHTIGVLCTILECSVEDIMEFRMDKSEGLYPIMENVPKQPEEDEAEESEPEESHNIFNRTFKNSTQNADGMCRNILIIFQAIQLTGAETVGFYQPVLADILFFHSFP